MKAPQAFTPSDGGILKGEEYFELTAGFESWSPPRSIRNPCPPHPWPLSRVGERGTEVHHVPSHDDDFSAICALVIKHKFLPRQYCPRKVFNRFLLCIWIFTLRGSFQQANGFAKFRVGRISTVG